MKTLQISDEKARELHKTGSSEVKSILEESFGKDLFSGKITDRVKTYEDACEELGIKPLNEEELTDLGMTPDDIAYQKLKVIIKALNEGWEPDMFDSSICRYYPWFRCNNSSSSFAFSDSACGDSSARAGGGSRLVLKTSELAEYCGTQFIDLWKQFIL